MDWFSGRAEYIMMGSGRLLSAGVDPSPKYGVFISPSEISKVVPNGTYRTPTLEAVVQGGVGPFTYEWTTTNPLFTPSHDDKKEIRVISSGYNTYRETELKVKIVDTGNANQITNGSASIKIEFGNK